jgi:membrane-associated phospholipid phosphatase
MRFASSRFRAALTMVLVAAWLGPARAEEPSTGKPHFHRDQGAAQPQGRSGKGEGASIREAVRSLPNDVARFVSVDTLLITGAGGAAALAAHPWDDETTTAVQGGATDSGAYAFGNAYGSVAALAGGALGAVVIGGWSHHDRLVQTGLDLLRAGAVTGVWVQALKVVADRDRPDGSRYSFPSGHAALAFATAGVVQREWGWRTSIPFFALASYAGAARVGTGHHYPSDVVFGAAMGLAGSHSLRLRERGNHAWRITPFVVPGGSGVTCSLTAVAR